MLACSSLACYSFLNDCISSSVIPAMHRCLRIRRHIIVTLLAMAALILQGCQGASQRGDVPVGSEVAPTATIIAAPAATPTVTVVPPSDTAAPTAAPLKRYGYEVVNIFPHDPAAFTQGLVYLDDVFYEGTGRYGQSSLRKVDPTTGNILQQHDLAEEFFGEGIAVVGDVIYQLTWQNGTGFMYDKETFAERRRFRYATEGWGLTFDGQHLIMSDGSATLYFLDPATLDEVRRIDVTVAGEPVVRLNELEYIDGRVLANIWQTDFIVQIDPASGVVDGVIDLTGLLGQAPPSQSAVDVLNGIAFDGANRRLFVTGKLWPYLFEIRLIEQS